MLLEIYCFEARYACEKILEYSIEEPFGVEETDAAKIEKLLFLYFFSRAVCFARMIFTLSYKSSIMISVLRLTL